MHVKLTLLLTNSMQTKQQIQANENLKKISLPSLTTTSGFFNVRDDPSPLLYTALSLSLTNHNLSLPPSLQVVGNPKLMKLCASELESVGGVCIGNNQPDLDADLSELVTGNVFDNSPFCSDSNAPTVCGPDGGLGLFSSPSNRCPSNACMMPLMSDNK